MKQVGKKIFAFLLAITMIAGMTLNDVTIARAEEKAPCITLSDGVKEEVNETTYIYNGYKPYLGDKFTDSEKHGMLYYVSRSVYDEESETWSEPSKYEEITIGFASSLPEYAVTESTPGKYKYSWKAYCKTTGLLSEATYTVNLTVQDPEETTYDMTFYVGRDNAGANKNPEIKLYKTLGQNDETGYDEFDESDEIELEGGNIDSSGQYRVYTASLNGGTYSYRAFGYDESTQEYTNPLGGMCVNVPMSSNVTQSGYDSKSVYIRCTNVSSRTKYDGNNYLTADQYTTEVVCPYYSCTATPGTPYVNAGITYYPYMLVAQGNACLYNYFAYPNKDIAEEYDLTYGYGINGTVQKGYSTFSWSPSVVSRITSAITVPDEAKAQVYFQMNNFRDKEIESYKQKTNSDGTVTWYFYVPKSNGNYSYRVSKDGYVTKAGYMSLGSEQSATFSVDLDRKDVTSHDFSGLDSRVLTRDEANLIMNVSDKNVKNIDVDETFRLRAYRVWEIINSDAGNIMIEPDFNYEILSGADNIDIEEVEDNRTNGKGNWLDIKGVKAGTAVIAVTYNAIDVDGTSSGGFYPAISPKRTGIAIIHVGNEKSDISDIGVKNVNGKDWCWNYDTFFFNGKEGSMNIAPYASSGIDKVEVIPVKTTDDLHSSFEDGTAVESNENGTYDVNLKEGNNIIKVTSKNGSVGYQVVRAAKVQMNYENMSNPGEKIMPGDKVKIIFDGLYRSIPKVSGIFNPVVLQIVGNTPDGTKLTGQISQYQVADSGSLEVTIPSDLTFEDGQEQTDYTISNGYINLQSMYSYADAWKYMYTLTDAGVGTCFNAVIVTGQHSTISDFSIPVNRKVTYGVNVNVTDEQGNEIKDYDLSVVNKNTNETVEDFSALGYAKYSYSISAPGYVAKYGTFTLGSKTEVTDGKTTITIVLKKADENAWDGKTFTEPQMDEEGTYLIGTGSELAWFANEVNSSTAKTTSALNAKLTKDIDLAGYNFPQISYYTSSSAYVYYGGTFDGDNHKIYNLRIDKTAINASTVYGGLFAYTNGAKLKNLTVEGDVAITALSTMSVINANTGGIVGYASNTEINNVTADVNVEIKDYVKGNWSYIGGICGYTKGTVIKNSKNKGTISGNRYTGGIVGNTNGTVENCVNEGNVISTAGYAGGIASEITTSAVVKNCINTANIESKTGLMIGGIVGYANGSVDSSVNNCISLGTVSSAATGDTLGSIIGSITRGKVTNCYGVSKDKVVCGKVNATYATVTDSYASDDCNEVLYKYATGKELNDCSEDAKNEIVEITSKYAQLLMDNSKTTEEKINAISDISNENFDKCILENENVNVTVNAQANNKFIVASKTVEVNGYLAERYGYTDAVKDGVSALDVLVAAHEYVYGDKFTTSTAKDYIDFSTSQYGTFVSKTFGKDASTFMYSINGKYPHNDELVNGYYTGYTVDQAKTADNDVVDFYFLQDAGYSDDLSTIKLDTDSTTTDKTFNVSVSGYNYAWYGACEQSVIEANTHAVKGAKIGIVDVKTGEITPIDGAVTDENGNATVNIDKAGKYIVTAYVDDKDNTPILMQQATINVEWAKPLEVKGVAIAKKNKNEVSVMWRQSLEQIRLGQIYNVYVDGELYNKYPAATTLTYTFDKAGKHTIKITSELNGFETEGYTVEVEIEEETTEESTVETTTEVVESTTDETTTKKVMESTTAKDITNVSTTASQTTETVTTTTNATTKAVKTVKIKKAVKKKSAKKVAIKLRKVKKAKGYEVLVARNNKFAGKKVIKITSKKVNVVVRKLKPNKTYYVKVRAYEVINGKKVYGNWSKIKKIKNKK